VTRGILVYYPDAGEARAYADLIRLPSRAFRVHVASTPEEAAGPGALAEIFYCWGPPRPLLANVRDDRLHRLLQGLSSPSRRHYAEVARVNASARRLENVGSQVPPSR